jgi:hypothetical protein
MAAGAVPAWLMECRLREVLKTNNAVELSFAEAVLNDAKIGFAVFDGHMSVMDGSMVILPRRLMVADVDEARAAAILREALAAKPEWA